MVVAARVEDQVGSREKALDSRESALGSREKALADATEMLRRQTAGGVAAARRAVNAELKALRQEISSETTALTQRKSRHRRPIRASRSFRKPTRRRCGGCRSNVPSSTTRISRYGSSSPSRAWRARRAKWTQTRLFTRVYFVFVCFLRFGEQRVLIFE